MSPVSCPWMRLARLRSIRVHCGQLQVVMHGHCGVAMLIIIFDLAGYRSARCRLFLSPVRTSFSKSLLRFTQPSTSHLHIQLTQTSTSHTPPPHAPAGSATLLLSSTCVFATSAEGPQPFNFVFTHVVLIDSCGRFAMLREMPCRRQSMQLLGLRWCRCQSV